ncbi:MAG: hypothetical protein J6B31_01715 [Bacteroidaceae bacterium]|nr:hypothetical protein [Bacteroidaceae bacterium]
MKYIKVVVSLALVFMLCSAFSLKSKKKDVYMAGVAASFTDSLVYFTDVMLVDSVHLNKNKLLPQRIQYSEQLSNYLLQKEGLKNRTCFIYFGTSKDKVKKTINKMKDKYKKSGKSQLREVNAEFKFTKATEY